MSAQLPLEDPIVGPYDLGLFEEISSLPEGEKKANALMLYAKMRELDEKGYRSAGDFYNPRDPETWDCHFGFKFYAEADVTRRELTAILSAGDSLSP